MKILHILDHSLPHHSGYVFRTLSILAQQRAMGWQTAHLTTPRHGRASAGDETVDGWTFYRTPAPPASWVPLRWVVSEMRATRDRLLEVIDIERPDVLHAHSPVLNAWPALSVGRRLGLPVVYEVRAFWEDAAVDHGTTREGSARYRLTRMMETHVLKRADAVTTICEGLRTDILARGVDQDRVTVIPNAVDIERFPLIERRDQALSDRLGLTGKEVLGFCGSFYAYEGLELLVRAMTAIREARPQTRLLLVGGGPAEPAIREAVSRLGLQDHVILTGRVPHDQVDRYYSLIDVLVYPRHRMRLTELVTPLKPLEAMAQGRVVLASDVGGHRELINDGRTGLLFPADDADRLADSAIRLLSDAELRNRLQREGRRFVETERSWAASVARYRPVYERLVPA